MKSDSRQNIFRANLKSGQTVFAPAPGGRARDAVASEEKIQRHRAILGIVGLSHKIPPSEP